jgi:hypothetical protein
MRLQQRFGILLTGLYFLASANASLKAATIFDSLTPAQQSGQTQSQALVQGFGAMVAQGFQTTALGYVLDSIELEIYKQTGSTDVYSVWIYNASGGVPTTPVLTVANNEPQSALSDQPSSKTFSGINTVLAPNSDYFVVVGGVGVTDLYWDYWDTASPAGTGLPTTSITFDGTSWTGSSQTYPQMMIVSASVPEPSTWAFAALSCTTMAYVARRRKQARAAKA